MPVSTTSNIHFSPGGGTPPGAPTAVTSITKDAGATVSFLAPASHGDSAITSYTATPYIAGVAQTPVTTAVGSAGSITGSNGSTYVQVPVTGLTNSTAYTFSVHAVNSAGAGMESIQSGANTPLSGLVFGDDFDGPVSGPLDPEWWVYTRCGFLGQSEVQYYLPDHCVLGGDGTLWLIAEKSSYTGPSYPSAGGGNQTQPWRSGACQSNTRTFTPTPGNTMTFESRFKCPPDIYGGGMWPGMFWLEGQDYLTAWKTDPAQATWNATGKAEIDIAEYSPGFGAGFYGNNLNAGSWNSDGVSAPGDASTAMHVYTSTWKPGVSVTWYLDGSVSRAAVTSGIPTSGCNFFLLLYLQILSGSATATQHCSIDYVRVWDQNLG